jgi:Protein of unknown function (DUF3356).
MTRVNPLRGEAEIHIGGIPHRLRPTFTALVAAEAELGPLYGLIERAGAGELRLSELAALFWHCLAPELGIARETVGEAIMAEGLAACAAPLRMVLAQILKGAG